MNEIGIAVVWAAARVTVFTVAAMLAYRLAARRGPASAVRTLVTILGLTIVVAVTSLPSVTGRSAIQAKSNALHAHSTSSDVTAAAPSLAPTEDVGGSGVRAFDLVRPVLDQLSYLRSLRPVDDSAWPSVVAVVFLVGVCIGAIRLLFGVNAVRHWYQDSRRVTDEWPSRLVNALCAAMRFNRRVEVRESPILAGPATVGWTRPIILLPGSWRSWSVNELRAVLAHELAHIRRGDFLATVFARAVEVVHFYHPLVYWLGSRLCMQQELAADALGARFAGGRRVYLQALARLALREDTRNVGWPARAFLPAHGTLVRRIYMLRSLKLVHGRSERRFGRVVAAALIIAAGLGATLLAKPIVHSTESEKCEAAVAKSIPPFDLTYVPDKGIGVVAFRPAETFQMPALRPHASLVNAMLKHGAKDIGLDGEVGLTVNDIEQVIGVHRFLHNPDQPAGQRRSIVTELAMVRTVKPYDWRKSIEALGTTVTEIKCDAGTYFKASQPFMPPIMPQRGMCFFMPDERTLVINTEDSLKELLRRKPNTLPGCVWAKGWKRVECDLFALAIDGRDKELAEAMEKEPVLDPTDKLWSQMLLAGRQTVFGASGNNELQLRAWCWCETEAAANEASKLTQTLYEKGKAELKNANPTNDHAKKVLGVFGDLMKNLRVHVDGKEVHWHTTAKPGIGELLSVSVQSDWAEKK